MFCCGGKNNICVDLARWGEQKLHNWHLCLKNGVDVENFALLDNFFDGMKLTGVHEKYNFLMETETRQNDIYTYSLSGKTGYLRSVVRKITCFRSILKR